MKNLKNKNRIILYDDDNHASEIYINGKAAGSLEDELDTLESVFNMCAAAGVKPLISKKVYLCDLPEDLTNDEADMIHNFFCKTARLTLEQEDAIFRDDYKALLQII